MTDKQQLLDLAVKFEKRAIALAEHVARSRFRAEIIELEHVSFLLTFAAGLRAHAAMMEDSNEPR